jgi:hypothetical protein
MSFTDQLDTAIQYWESGDVVDEWMFQKLRDEVVGNMRSDEAFESIEFAVLRLLEHQGEFVANEILETVLSLARRSQTTEIPPALAAAQCELTDQFGRYGEYSKTRLRELFRYYRM